MDAAIAEGYKDFKFVNNTDAPIYIMGYADGSEIGFVIYGHETRDPNRKVTYESETLTTTESTTELVADSSASYGSVTLESSGHTGYTARLWKVVTVNGEETREQVNSSTYNMTPNTYHVGTSTSDSAALAAMQSAIASNDLSKVSEAAAQYPGGTSPASSSSDTGSSTSDSGRTTDNSSSGSGSSGSSSSGGSSGGGDSGTSSSGQGSSGGQADSAQTSGEQSRDTGGEGGGE